MGSPTVGPEPDGSVPHLAQALGDEARLAARRLAVVDDQQVAVALVGIALVAGGRARVGEEHEGGGDELRSPDPGGRERPSAREGREAVRARHDRAHPPRAARGRVAQRRAEVQLERVTEHRRGELDHAAGEALGVDGGAGRRPAATAAGGEHEDEGAAQTADAHAASSAAAMSASRSSVVSMPAEKRMKPSDTASVPHRARRSAEVCNPPKLVASVTSELAARKAWARAASARAKPSTEPKRVI